MLEERSVIDQITILEDGQIQVRRADKVFRDGVEISKTFHRHVVAPGANLASEESLVQKVARVVHTTEIIASYNKAIKASE